MGRPKKKEPTVRVQVTMPRSVYERFERMADVTSSEVNTLVRMLASLQLVTWEGVYLKGSGIENPSYEQAQQWVRESVPGLYPDLPGVAEQLLKQQEQELVAP